MKLHVDPGARHQGHRIARKELHHAVGRSQRLIGLVGGLQQRDPEHQHRDVCRRFRVGLVGQLHREVDVVLVLGEPRAHHEALDVPVERERLVEACSGKLGMAQGKLRHAARPQRRRGERAVVAVARFGVLVK